MNGVLEISKSKEHFVNGIVINVKKMKIYVPPVLCRLLSTKMSAIARPINIL
jgi:hypothetical protein